MSETPYIPGPTWVPAIEPTSPMAMASAASPVAVASSSRNDSIPGVTVCTTVARSMGLATASSSNRSLALPAVRRRSSGATTPSLTCRMGLIESIVPRKAEARPMRRAVERALQRGNITLKESALFLRHYENGLSGTTYLEEDSAEEAIDFQPNGGNGGTGEAAHGGSETLRTYRDS